MDAKELQHQIGEIIDQTTMTALLAQSIDAVDKFACAAMAELIRVCGGDLPPADLARMAWAIADAMLTERQRRIGKERQG